MSKTRENQRQPHQLRPCSIQTDFTMHAEGSVLVQVGHTKVICTASVENQVPPFRRRLGQGWISAEYSMLPRATNTRNLRAVSSSKPNGRNTEIQRLIGRSLRSAVDMSVLGEHTIWIDCDVIQADGGTRTAAITGGFVALVLALRHIAARQPFARPPLQRHVAALSLGLVDGQLLLDLDYDEDSRAQVDMNLVMTEAGEIIEIQGTAEENPFPSSCLQRMLELGEAGIAELVKAQRSALGDRLL